MKTENDQLSEHFRGANLKHYVPEIIRITNELRPYWPVTVRQIYYQTVAQGIYSNNIGNYQKTSRILTTLRRELFIPWLAIEDRTRRTADKRGVTNMQNFVREQMECFLDPRYYHRCYVQKQSRYIEVSIEKDALSSIMEDAVWDYCVRLTVTRGQLSSTFVNEMAVRFEAAINRGLEPILLHFGDLDPSGVAIPWAIKESLIKHHDLHVTVERIALNPEHIEKYNLPRSVDAAKKTDPNYKKWKAAYGNMLPTELDAMHPRDLKQLVAESLEGYLDMSSFSEERIKEAAERELLQQAKIDVEDFLFERHKQLFTNATSGR